MSVVYLEKWQMMNWRNKEKTYWRRKRKTQKNEGIKTKVIWWRKSDIKSILLAHSLFKLTPKHYKRYHRLWSVSIKFVQKDAFKVSMLRITKQRMNHHPLMWVTAWLKQLQVVIFSDCLSVFEHSTKLQLFNII